MVTALSYDRVYGALIGEPMAATISAAVGGSSLPQCVEAGQRRIPVGSWLSRQLIKALHLAEQAASPYDLAAELSDQVANASYSFGTVAPETLASTYALTLASGGDPMTTIPAAATIAKQADSALAMTAAIAGALSGVDRLPAAWRRKVTTLRGVCVPELQGVSLTELADALVGAGRGKGKNSMRNDEFKDERAASVTPEVGRRAVMFGSALALGAGLYRGKAAGQPAGQPATLTAYEQPADEISFQDLNGFMWFYNTYFGYKFSDITRDLDNLKHDGIRVLGFYCPYNGDPLTADGCDPLDFYSVPPQNGTIQDWRDLVAAAHQRGMKVVCYFVNIYMDVRSDYFKKAEQQYWNGDLTSREVSSFHWTQNMLDPLPVLKSGPPGVNSWAYSSTADAFYWSLWFGPGFDYDLPGNAAEVARIEEFWLDTGLDGFIWDVGLMSPQTQKYQIELPKSYSPNPKWLTLEMAGAVPSAGSSSAQADAQELLKYGLTCWYNYLDDYAVNDYTNIVTGVTDADGLEAALSNADFARENGCTTRAWSIWGDDRKANLIPHSYPTYSDDDVMRVQEAALLAGAGIHYGSGMYDQYIRWSDTLRANWNRVLQTVNNNKALLPSANRTRVPASPGRNVYAMRRTGADGAQAALLIYNFNSTATEVTVDLAGTGIAVNQVPVDLYNGGAGPAINGTSYTVSMPPYGFKILQVSLGSTIRESLISQAESRFQPGRGRADAVVGFRCAPGHEHIDVLVARLDVERDVDVRLTHAVRETLGVVEQASSPPAHRYTGGRPVRSAYSALASGSVAEPVAPRYTAATCSRRGRLTNLYDLTVKEPAATPRSSAPRPATCSGCVD